ncbi:MAG: hypothetical protein K0Q49_686 [Haloplasmataceae bacterium]|jgi:hypothetical protein|nr:hypothetical protein [Haloplasmataceae bacterium]
MGNKFVNVLVNMVKMPYIFSLYLLIMFFSLFVPSKIISKIINIEFVENNINFFFNNSFYLKFIALIITVIIYIYN